MNIHDKVRAKIEAGASCYAQGRIDGKIVSLHPQFLGFGMTVSGDIVGSEYTYHDIKALLIDDWVLGHAIAGPQTFALKELEHRASEHHYGNGPGIIRGDKDEEMAQKILEFAQQNQGLLSDEPCPH